MFLGRIIGTIIGYLVYGPLTAVIGFFVGMYFDRGLSKIGNTQTMDPGERDRVEKALFAALFPIMGRLAKADGRISEEEIESAEHLMSRMGLSSDGRQEAIRLFKHGADSDYDMDVTLAEFMRVCGAYNNLKQMFLVYLITVAYADSVLHEEEERLLEHVADKLGYSRLAFNHLLGMIRAQTHFYKGNREQAGFQQQQSSQSEIELAYQALGVESSISDAELKKAYRKLMSEYHPDKLAGRGAPEDMVKLATERSQEIQSAYDLLKKHRK